jgi:uncharacterized protein
VTARARAAAFLAGLVFAIGLCISGMTKSEKVTGFLDVTGDWDPSLALVMVGAISVHVLFRRLYSKREKPAFAEAFAPPTKTRIDVRLVIGAALFGVGWGLSGYCPGPALVNAVTGARPVLVFVAAMMLGMALFDALSSDA